MKRYVAVSVAVLLVVGAIGLLASGAIVYPESIKWIPTFAGHIKAWLLNIDIRKTDVDWTTTLRENLPLVYLCFLLSIFALYFIGRVLVPLHIVMRALKCSRLKAEDISIGQVKGPNEFGRHWSWRQAKGESANTEQGSHEHPPDDSIPRLRVFGPVLAGLVIIALFFGGFVGWAAFAPLSNAAIASGKVKVESYRKTIQHLEGGIVHRILVRDGVKVQAGQILIELDATKPLARLARLQGQLDAGVKQLGFLNEEIKTVSDLLERGYANKPRLLALQRRAAELEGERRRITAEIDDAKDILKRSKIRTPIEGTIVGLKVHTPGGVIKTGDALMDVVPKRERLIIQAHMNPIDIDVMQEGLKAMVYLTPYNRRSLRPVEGRVMTISADLVNNEQTNQSYYIADIELVEDPHKAIKGAILYPGMPVEVMILTGEQTMLQAIFQPIWQSVNRSFRES